MLRLVKKYSKEIDAILLIVGFVTGMNFLAYLKLAGLEQRDFYDVNPSFHGWIPTIGGLTVGISLAVAEFGLFEKVYATVTYRWALLIRIGGTAVIIASEMVILGTVNRILYLHQAVGEALLNAVWFLGSAMGITVFLYMFILSMRLNFFRQLGNHFGHGLIMNFITGRYAQAKEEHRTFMFIDLNQSTTLAEQLGHVKYSRMLNKCFDDLSGFLARYEADVYQYVGDEVVLTWLTEEVRQVDIAGLYFDFRDKLQQDASYYRAKFGIVPQFKASIHSGLVSITQVGKRRKELAFHGDVLNTASRVLAVGSRLKKELLVTTSVVSVLQRSLRYQVSLVDTLVLRGKRESTEVFEVILEEKSLYSGSGTVSLSNQVAS